MHNKWRGINTNENSNLNPTVNSTLGYVVDYFLPSPGREGDRIASTKLRKQMHNEDEDVFMGIGGFEATFTSQIEDGSKL